MPYWENVVSQMGNLVGYNKIPQLFAELKKRITVKYIGTGKAILQLQKQALQYGKIYWLEFLINR